MIYALIFMYILQANGFVIPTGCFVAAWIITAILFVDKIFDKVRGGDKD